MSKIFSGNHVTNNYLHNNLIHIATQPNLLVKYRISNQEKIENGFTATFKYKLEWDQLLLEIPDLVSGMFKPNMMKVTYIPKVKGWAEKEYSFDKDLFYRMERNLDPNITFLEGEESFFDHGNILDIYHLPLHLDLVK